MSCLRFVVDGVISVAVVASCICFVTTNYRAKEDILDLLNLFVLVPTIRRSGTKKIR